MRKRIVTYRASAAEGAGPTLGNRSLLLGQRAFAPTSSVAKLFCNRRTILLRLLLDWNQTETEAQIRAHIPRWKYKGKTGAPYDSNGDLCLRRQRVRSADDLLSGRTVSAALYQAAKPQTRAKGGEIVRFPARHAKASTTIHMSLPRVEWTTSNRLMN